MKLGLMKIVSAVAVLSLTYPTQTDATNGYFKHGYGARSESMGGVGVALAFDGLTPATNPAGIAGMDNRLDVGMTMFNPIRGATFDTSGLGGGPSSDDSAETFFVIPELGVVRNAGRVTLGFSLFGNGGMNTTYERNVFDQGFYGPAGSGAPDTETLGVDLAQLLISTSVAYRIGSRHDVGASLVLGYQRFEAYGLGNFQCFTATANSTPDCASGNPPVVLSSNLTNQGVDDAAGVGVRLGWLGRVSPGVSLGATYASKIYMQRFDKYRELFADGGSFDIPANLALGLALEVTPRFHAALDLQHIFYSDVPAVGNPGPTAAELIGGAMTPERLLGASQGIGFGWKDMTVFKLGFRYLHPSGVTFLHGISYGTDPIHHDESLFAILAPAVIRTHLTAGIAYADRRNGGLTIGYTHALREDQQRTYFLGPASYTAKLGMNQRALRLDYAWKF